MWAKCLLTGADCGLWESDVEFVAALYNVFLRRDQVRAVETHLKKLKDAEKEALQSLSAAARTLHQHPRRVQEPLRRRRNRFFISSDFRINCFPSSPSAILDSDARILSSTVSQVNPESSCPGSAKSSNEDHEQSYKD